MANYTWAFVCAAALLQVAPAQTSAPAPARLYVSKQSVNPRAVRQGVSQNDFRNYQSYPPGLDVPGNEGFHEREQDAVSPLKRKFKIGAGILGALALLLALSTIIELPGDVESGEDQVDGYSAEEEEALVEKDVKTGVATKVLEKLRENRRRVQSYIPKQTRTNWQRLKNLLVSQRHSYLLMFNRNDSSSEDEDLPKSGTDGQPEDQKSGDKTQHPEEVQIYLPAVLKKGYRAEDEVDHGRRGPGADGGDVQQEAATIDPKIKVVKRINLGGHRKGSN